MTTLGRLWSRIPKLFQILLGIATLVGGIAGVFFLVDRFSDGDPVTPPNLVSPRAPAVVLPDAPIISGIDCSPQAPRVGEEVTCAASVGGGRPESWSWTGGGDPASGSGQTFRTVFATAGNRTIELTVRNAGGSDVSGTTVEVPPTPSAQDPPPQIEDVVCSPQAPRVGEEVTCAASVGGGRPESWSWTGGGDPAGGSAQTFRTVFTAAGNRTIELTVRNAGGSDASRTTVEVPPTPSPQDPPPRIEDVVCSPLAPRVGEEVTCEAKIAGGRPESWSWTGGGDPAGGSGQTFRTVFTAAGNRTIELTVRNAGGSYASGTTVEVRPTPSPQDPPPQIEDVVCSPQAPRVGEEVTCAASVGGGRPESWSWTGGGDSASGSGQTFRTVFAAAGNRTIELTVRNANGSDTGSALIEVAPRLLGECREGTVVRPGEECDLPDRVGGAFAVDANGYATLGRYRTDYDAPGIKIDLGDPGSPNAYAIQAERRSDRAWEIRVLGLWLDRGECRAGMRLFAGEFCHPPRASDGSYRRFDVYAVDELQENDVRTVREEDGYAVLWVGGQHNVGGSVVSVPNFYARKAEDVWTIQNPGP